MPAACHGEQRTVAALNLRQTDRNVSMIPADKVTIPRKLGSSDSLETSWIGSGSWQTLHQFPTVVKNTAARRDRVRSNDQKNKTKNARDLQKIRASWKNTGRNSAARCRPSIQRAKPGVSRKKHTMQAATAVRVIP